MRNQYALGGDMNRGTSLPPKKRMADHRNRQPWCSSAKICVATVLAGLALFLLLNRTFLAGKPSDVALTARLGGPKPAADMDGMDTDRVGASPLSNEHGSDELDVSESASSTTEEPSEEEGEEASASNVAAEQTDTDTADTPSMARVSSSVSPSAFPAASSGAAPNVPPTRVGGPFTFPPAIEFSTCGEAVEAQEELSEQDFDGVKVVTNIKGEHMTDDSLASMSALVLLFHGCSNSKESWLLGAPERTVVHDFLRSNALIIGFSAHSTEVPDSNHCWLSSPPSTNADLKTVLRVMRHLAAANANFGSLPLVGLGVSSGSGFLAMLATILSFESMALYIAPVNYVFSDDPSKRNHEGVRDMITGLPEAWLGHGMPRIVVVHMPKDDRMERLIHASIDELSTHAGIVIQELECLPFEYSAHLLHMRMPSRISSVDSEVIYQQMAPLLNEDAPPGNRIMITTNPARLQDMLSLVVQNMLDRRGKDGILHAYPNDCCNRNEANGKFSSNGLCSRSDELDTLDLAATGSNERFVAAKDRLVTVVLEVLKTAFARHEMTADHSAEVATFLLSTRTSTVK